MSDYEPMALPTTAFFESNTHDMNESRKRKNRTSTNEAFFANYQWQQPPQPFAFDDFQQQDNTFMYSSSQQPMDPIQSLLSSPPPTSSSSSSYAVPDPNALNLSWHATSGSFPSPSFLDPSVKNDFDLMASLSSQTSMPPASTSGNAMAPPSAPSNSTGSLPPPLSTGGTPPSSPATLPSTTSSPGISPMYGRMNNLTIRQTLPYSTAKPETIDISAYEQLDFQPSPSPTSPLPVSGHPMRSAMPPRNLHAVATARVMQQQATAAKIRPVIQRYLHANDPMAMGEKTVIIMSSKVAQKSYGTEKRFLCPPPTAILVGSTWWSSRPSNDLKALLNEANLSDQEDSSFFQHGHGDTAAIVTPPRITVCISGESSSQPGQIEWYTRANATVVGQTGFPRQPNPTNPVPNDNNTRFKSHATETRNNGNDWYHNPRSDAMGGGRCVSKQLFINDADEKRKRVECLVKIQAQGLWQGTLAGKGIKVISKPSKKRQSVKNMDLCIHHGSIVSLFNRIRSQTVSTKYLGVSNGTDSPFAYPGQHANLTDPSKNASGSNDGTCFVARTTSWDPFIIWLVDTSRTPEQQKFRDDRFGSHLPEDFIGHRSFNPNVKYPPPPAIALRNATQQPLAIHYNQHIVLQCLTTGLVSPVMIIRKVDKASTVVGGARCMDEPLQTNGGEFGDEILGDPVSQLHKVALQIVHDPSQNHSSHAAYQQHPGADLIAGIMEYMLPRYSSPVSYLACLNDMVGMHKSTEQRQPILKNPPPPPASSSAQPLMPSPGLSMTSSLSSATTAPAMYHEELVEENGRVVRKRKVSSFGTSTANPGLPPPPTPPHPLDTSADVFQTPRCRGNSYDDYGLLQQPSAYPSTMYAYQQPQPQPQQPWPSNPRARSVSIDDRRVSTISTSSSSSTSNSWINGPLGGAYWSEDVSDAAVWTLVGTDIASYTFLPPPAGHQDTPLHGSADALATPLPSTSTSSSSSSHRGSMSSAPVMFPHLSHYTNLPDDAIQLHGENLARDMQVWFGDVKAPHVEYKSRECVVAKLPPRQDLVDCPFVDKLLDQDPVSTHSSRPSSPSYAYQLPLLLVKAVDNIVHKTGIDYSF
ncbi:LAG1-DNAbind-domain-containing protein [Hesseltinella vesiculosa]|uniref:LAG1-DNAbind-domain-containing protein n=1 Tax=Hesseltinella vesiculosa TaxID=101127 RepID=A0A1X2GWV0_9FUNG|nr:LAG1-DNAbind-domain-containing protein [Hesseltinella vesiculosa]